MKKEVLILSILALAGVLLFGCKSAEEITAPETEMPETETPEVPTEEPTTPAPETPETETPAETEMPEETTAETPTELLSDFVCDETKGVIEATLTNIYDKSLTIGDDIKIDYFGKYPVDNPGCEKIELAPGESTKCINLNGNNRVTPRIFIVVKVNGERHKYRFNCEEYAPTKEETTEETAEETGTTESTTE